MQDKGITPHPLQSLPAEKRPSISSIAYAYAYILIPLALTIGVIIVLHLLGETFDGSKERNLNLIANGLIQTLARLSIAYVAALCVAIPLALMVDSSPLATKICLPIYDTLQSIPYLIFLPVIVLVFTQVGFLQGATVVLLFLGMLWALVFNLITGLRVVPTEIKNAGHVFGARKFKFFWNVTLPAVTPYLITGSLLAWGAGWNLVIVAEVLHTYLPSTVAVKDVLGIGNVLVTSETTGNSFMFVSALFTIISIVVIMNFFVWQKLLSYAERFRFE